MSRGRLSTLGAAALLAAGLAGCGSSSHASTTPVTVFNVSADPSANIPVGTAKHAVLTAAALRSTLDALLSKHAALVGALAHQVDQGNDTPTAAISALAANTQSLTDAIALVYGPDAGRAFSQLWEQHTQFFIDYAQAERAHDGEAKADAESELLDYRKDFASFVSTATAGGVGLVAVTQLLHTHVQDITSYIDADVRGHSADADQLLARAVAHMHVIAKAVADAIAAQHLATVKS